jgi:hypothetical protein
LDGTLLAAAATASATNATAITGEGRAATERVPVAPASDDLKIPRDDYDNDDGGGGVRRHLATNGLRRIEVPLHRIVAT